jgi:hypothetical protein
MLARRAFASLAGILFLAAALPADDTLTSNVRLSADGVNVDGVIGYRIEFSRQAVLRTDSRRLGLAYSPDDRKLQLTVNQNGLNHLQEWLNTVTDGGTPGTRTIIVTALDAKDKVLVRWQLNGVVPTTVSQAAGGEFNGVTATVEFLFDTMRLLEASAN